MVATDLLAFPYMVDEEFLHTISQISDKLDMILTDAYIVKGVLPAIVWNYTKILVVNGKTMLTVGGNHRREFKMPQKPTGD